MIPIKIYSEYKHSDIHETAFIARLTPPTDDYNYDRKFILRKNLKRNNYDFYFEWKILNAGVYEKKESHPYQADKVSYFAVNNAGDVINIVNKKEVDALIYSKAKWSKLSKLRIQLLKLRTTA